MGDISYLPPPDPFWFASSELLDELLRVELSLINRLHKQQPELRGLLDNSAATASDRKTCFTLLAHRKVLEMISEMFAARYEVPSLTDEESNGWNATSGFVTSDAPDWVLDMDRVMERLPNHIFKALPEALRTGRTNQNDAAQMDAIRGLGTLGQLQSLIERVFDKQLGRLEARWSASSSLIPSQPPPRIIKKKKSRRRHDKQRADRDKLIAEIAEAAETPAEFLRLMDERKVPRHPTWNGWPGSWAKAYRDPHLRKLIHQDKSRAILRARRHK
jgi:hypothetical protein